MTEDTDQPEDPSEFVDSLTEDQPTIDKLVANLDAAKVALLGNPEPVTAYRHIETAIGLAGELQDDES